MRKKLSLKFALIVIINSNGHLFPFRKYSIGFDPDVHDIIKQKIKDFEYGSDVISSCPVNLNLVSKLICCIIKGYCTFSLLVLQKINYYCCCFQIVVEINIIFFSYRYYNVLSTWCQMLKIRLVCSAIYFNSEYLYMLH